MICKGSGAWAPATLMGDTEEALGSWPWLCLAQDVVALQGW